MVYLFFLICDAFSLKFGLENWQKINKDPVCLGARDNQYGAFLITKSGLLKTIKLVHKSGSLKCNADDPASNWGCTHAQSHGNNVLLTTIITNSKKETVLPSAGDLNANYNHHSYHINGITHTSPELVFPDPPNKVLVSRSQEFQIWFGQDWIDLSEENNSGTTCVDVYAWYT